MLLKTSFFISVMIFNNENIHARNVKNYFYKNYSKNTPKNI